MQSYSFLLFRFTGIQTSSHNSFALLFPCCTLPASFLWLPWLLALHLGEDCSYPFILSHPYPCSDSSSQSRLFSHLVEECSGNSQLTLSHSLASAGELSISSEGSGQPFWLNPLQRVPYRPIFWNLFLVFSALQSHFTESVHMIDYSIYYTCRYIFIKEKTIKALFGLSILFIFICNIDRRYQYDMNINNVKQ